jgi:acyl carrier protein
MEVARDAMAFARLGIGALCLGGMKRCAQLMLRYASRREVAGGRLLEHPVTLARLDGLTGAIGALEALVRALGAYDDRGGAHGIHGALPQEACMACKCVASELLWEAADMLMQMLGGRGYLEPNLAPLLMRDARVMRILEGPTEALYVHLGAGALDGGCLAFAADVLDAPDVAQQARAALLAAGAACPSHAAGELCAWTLLVAACGDGPAAPWARRRWSALLAQLRHGAPAAPATLAARVAAYADAIGMPDQAAGEGHARDPLLEPGWSSGAGEAAALAPVCAPAKMEPTVSAPASAGLEDTRALVRRCLLYGLDGGVETLGDDQPFAEVGLDSLSAMPVALALERQTGMAINAELLYEYQTVAQLAAYLDAKRAAGAAGTAQEGVAQEGAAGG